MMVKKEEKVEYTDTYGKIHKIMFPAGLETGHEICELLKEKDNVVLPLYRSAIVITFLSNGNIRLDTFHDPQWMGEDLTKETLKRFHCNTMIFQGQRSGVDIHLTDGYMASLCNYITKADRIRSFEDLKEEEDVE